MGKVVAQVNSYALGMLIKMGMRLSDEKGQEIIQMLVVLVVIVVALLPDLGNIKTTLSSGMSSLNSQLTTSLGN